MKVHTDKSREYMEQTEIIESEMRATESKLWALHSRTSQEYKSKDVQLDDVIRLGEIAERVKQLRKKKQLANRLMLDAMEVN